MLMSSCDRGMAESRPHMTWLRPENTSNVVLPGQGHLVSLFLEVIEVYHSDVRGYSCVRKCLRNSVGFNSAREMTRVSDTCSRL